MDRIYLPKPQENRNQSPRETEDIFMQSLTTSEETRYLRVWKNKNILYEQGTKSPEKKHAQICMCGGGSGERKGAFSTTDLAEFHLPSF